MKRRDSKARAEAGLEEAVARLARERAASAGRGPEPWPGDLFVFSETADFSVEWLLVERERRSRCRIVAADTNPLLGQVDLALPPEAPGGPLSVRCAVGLSIEVESLRQGQRIGALAAEDLDRVRQRCREQDAGVLADSRLGAGGEPDPDYEDWLDEVLLPALAALSPAVEERVRHERRWGFYGVAAALALLLAFSGVSALAWRSRQAEQRAWREVHRLEGERQRLLVAQRQERAAVAAVEAAEARRIADLHKEAAPSLLATRRPPLALLANLAYVSFYPGEARGDLRELPLPSGATYLVVLFYIGQQPPYPEYRLEVIRGAGGPALDVPGLRPLPSEEVSVALPRAQLPDGVYHLHLDGISGDARKSVGEYEMRIRSQESLVPER